MATNAVRPIRTWTTDVSERMTRFRNAASGLILGRGGLHLLRYWQIYADFLAPEYQNYNLARLQHLDSLQLPLSGKRILELGAGIGDNTLFYLYRGCRVLPIEGRPKSAEVLQRRLGIEVRVMDLEQQADQLETLGEFDFVHCYGLLYHLSSPQDFLSHVSKIRATLVLETCVSFDENFEINLTPEPPSTPSQAIHGRGCRPSRGWVFETLKAYYPHVYTTRTQPKHPEFPMDWSVPLHKGPYLTRAVFVASHSALESPWLFNGLPSRHETW